MSTSHLRAHPYREAVLAELHARPVEFIAPGTRVRRLIVTVHPRAGSMREAIAAFRDFAAERGLQLGTDGARQFAFVAEARRVTWEFHTEFITITWTSPLDDLQNWPDGIGLEVLGETLLVGATRVDVLDETEFPERLWATFNHISLCAVAVENGAAQVASDFVPDEDRFTRFEFAAAGLSPLRRAITLRRLLEVDTYRTMALLGLPLARQTALALRAAEIELTELVENLSDLAGSAQIQERLNGLHRLSLTAGQLSEKLGYRFAASRAYGAILRRRLEKLRETTIGQGASLSSFIENRVEPALATCDAMEERLRVLADKIARGIELLNVRISLDMQIQNKAVLEAIAETGRSQFRLQRTVEGLSTIAITYYLLGIAGYALAAPIEAFGWNKTLVISLAAPLALLGVWLSIRAIRKRHI